MLHLEKLGVKLTKLRPEQADYIGVPSRARSSPTTTATKQLETAGLSTRHAKVSKHAAGTLGKPGARFVSARCVLLASFAPSTGLLTIDPDDAGAIDLVPHQPICLAGWQRAGCARIIPR